MSRFLDIFDVSGFIYTGYMSNVYASGGKDSVEGFPVTGVRYLLKAISYSLAQRRDVVLCFDSKLDNSKYKNTEYKKGRPKIHAVYAQMDFAYEVLSDCNLVCLKAYRQEADNLIFNVVEANKSNYDLIQIFTTDYDIAHNVLPNVKMLGANSLTNIVTKDNFNVSIVPGKTIAWNSISAYKVFSGDKSDTIKPFTSEKGIPGSELYNRYISVISGYLNNQKGTDTIDHIEFRSKDLLIAFFNVLGDELTDNDIKLLKERIDLVFPSVNSLFDYTSVSNVNNCNMSKYIDLLIMLQDRASYKTLTKTQIIYRSLKDSEVKLFQKYSKSLSTGSFAVEKGLEFSTQFSDDSSINIKGI